MSTEYDLVEKTFLELNRQPFFHGGGLDLFAQATQLEILKSLRRIEQHLIGPEKTIELTAEQAVALQNGKV